MFYTQVMFRLPHNSTEIQNKPKLDQDQFMHQQNLNDFSMYQLSVFPANILYIGNTFSTPDGYSTAGGMLI